MQLLRLAAGEARDLGHSYVGSEHLLLGLVAQQDTISGQVLRSTGLEPAGLRAMTAALLGQGAPGRLCPRA